LSGRWRIKTQFVEALTHPSRMAPCTRDADLRNGSHQEGGRERTHMQNNINAKLTPGEREGEREHTYKATSIQSLSN
jgi:hypothetical protein